jgi:hypothetical protein
VEGSSHRLTVEGEGFSALSAFDSQVEGRRGAIAGGDE